MLQEIYLYSLFGSIENKFPFMDLLQIYKILILKGKNSSSLTSNHKIYW